VLRASLQTLFSIRLGSMAKSILEDVADVLIREAVVDDAPRLAPGYDPSPPKETQLM
jgi:hypothetical protein